MLARDILKKALIRHGYSKRKAHQTVTTMSKLPQFALFLAKNFPPGQVPKQTMILETVFHLPITAVEALSRAGDMVEAANAKKN